MFAGQWRVWSLCTEVPRWKSHDSTATEMYKTTASTVYATSWNLGGHICSSMILRPSSKQTSVSQTLSRYPSPFFFCCFVKFIFCLLTSDLFHGYDELRCCKAGCALPWQRRNGPWMGGLRQGDDSSDWTSRRLRRPPLACSCNCCSPEWLGLLWSLRLGSTV